MTEDAEAMGAAWMRYGQPGPGHALLATFEGTWSQKSEIWPFPGAPAQTFACRSEMTLLYGGRYLRQVMSGGMEMQGLTVEFAGTGFFGFNNFSQKHFFSWIDNSTTMLMYGEGGADDAGTITYFGELPDPMTGQSVPFKAVLWKEGPDQFVFDNFGKLPDGSWHLKMRMTSQRA